jgi:hypothetical protein
MVANPGEMHTVRGEIFPRRVYIYRVYIYYEASDQRSFSSKLKLPVAVGECLSHPSAFGDVDVSAHNPLRAAMGVIRN